MPPPPQTAVAAAADAERQIRAPDVEFGLGPAQLRAFADRPDVRAPLAAYVDPGRARYVVVAVDPAGGGERSDEALVVFLVRGDRFGLLTGRIVLGHSRRYAFSTVPLVFVLALLETLRTVRRMLLRAHTGAAAFVMPPVLVVMETNYAYGAAVHLQVLWLLQRTCRRHADLRDVEIVFATPVYGWDLPLSLLRVELADARAAAAAAAAENEALAARIDRLWRERGPRQHGLNLQNILAAVEAERRAGDAVDVAREARRVMDGVMERVAARGGPQERQDFLAVWAEHFQGVLGQHLVARERARRLGAVVARLQRRIADREGGGDADGADGADADGAAGGGDGQQHPFVRATPWPADHRLTANPPGVAFPPGRWWNAPKTAFGEWTTQREKLRAYRHWVHLLRSAAPLARPPQLIQWADDNAAAARDAAYAPLAPDCRGRVAREAGPCPDLPPSELVLRCVHEQWRTVPVFVDPANRLVRTGGKGPDADADPHNDLWMAFAIGLQWCTRFTQLVPDDAQRAVLVRLVTTFVHPRLSGQSQTPIEANRGRQGG